MSYNRCKDVHKFGNKYLPLAYKTQVDFRSHFLGKKVRLIVREIRYIYCENDTRTFQCQVHKKQVSLIMKSPGIFLKVKRIYIQELN